MKTAVSLQFGAGDAARSILYGKCMCYDMRKESPKRGHEEAERHDSSCKRHLYIICVHIFWKKNM